MTKLVPHLVGLDPDLNVSAAADIPTAFSWRGHRYVVQSVLMHWVEAGPWWQAVRDLADFCEPDDLDATWQIWRVEARSVVGTLIGDLAQRVSLTSASAYPWRMIRVFD